jgi:hypothetical protein
MLIAGSIMREYRFSYFLNEYLHSLNKEKTEFFTRDRFTWRTTKSLLNDKDNPVHRIFVRLEIHSNLIPAIDWFRFMKNRWSWNYCRIRKKESRHVKFTVAV